VPQLRNLLARDGKLALGVEVDLASVLDVQLVQLWADLAPDARFLRRVGDDRRAAISPAGLSTQSEQVLPPAGGHLGAPAGDGPAPDRVRSRPAASPSSGDRWGLRIQLAWRFFA